MVLRYFMTRTWMSVVGLLVLVPGAAWDYFMNRPGAHSCVFLTTYQGANIELACRVVAYSGAAVLLALPFTLGLTKDSAKGGYRGVVYRRALAVLFVLEAGAVALAIGLLLADSATHIAAVARYDYECENGPDILTRHLYILPVVSGVTLLFLLLRAYGAWTGVERVSRVRTAELAS